MLKGDAEDEGIVFNDTSEQDFWEFMRSNPYTLKADIVVTDSGNLRAVWRGDGVKHMGLQFLGGRWIEYVMWTRRTGSMNIWTKAGRDTFEDVKERIRGLPPVPDGESSQAALVGDLIADCVSETYPGQNGNP